MGWFGAWLAGASVIRNGEGGYASFERIQSLSVAVTVRPPSSGEWPLGSRKWADWADFWLEIVIAMVLRARCT